MTREEESASRISQIESVSTKLLHAERCRLYVPSLDELSLVLSKSLHENFAEYHVSIETCPDLSGSPWNLAGGSLSGSMTALLDVGGVPNLLDPAFNGLSFPLNEVLDCLDVPEGSRISVLGAGAGDLGFIGVNSELMPSESGFLDEGKFTCDNGSFVAYFKDGDDNESPVLERYRHGNLGILANLYASVGEDCGPVLKIHAKGRKGQKNLVACLRDGLEKEYEKTGKMVGLGGAFKISGANFKAHVMPDFPGKTMVDGPEVDQWLRYMQLHSHEETTFMATVLGGKLPEQLHLRPEHVHFFNETLRQGGHFHYDLSPDEVDYTGYFHPAQWIYRIEDAFDRSKNRRKP